MTRLLPLLFLTSLHASDPTTLGEITIPYPTITNLAAEWRFQGDDNLNAT